VTDRGDCAIGRLEVCLGNIRQWSLPCALGLAEIVFTLLAASVAIASDGAFRADSHLRVGAYIICTHRRKAMDATLEPTSSSVDVANKDHHPLGEYRISELRMPTLLSTSLRALLSILVTHGTLDRTTGKMLSGGCVLRKTPRFRWLDRRRICEGR